MTLAAAIDVGSNTLRLLIAQARAGMGLKTIDLERTITRLSQGLTPGGRLHPAARERSLAVLDRFAALVRRRGVSLVFGGATAAVRLAVDGDDFLAEVRRETGLTIRKLAGEEEARLTALGVLHGLDGLARGRVLVVDPGGQSTEFIPVEGGVVRPGLSLNLGVVGLTEALGLSDPPTADQVTGLKTQIERHLDQVKGFYPPAAGLTVAGTAGTVTTIAAMLLKLAVYDPARVTGLRMSLEEIRGLRARVAPLPLAQRRSLPGLEPGREDVILAGLLLVEGLLEAYGLTELVVVDAGLLEGLIIDGLGFSLKAENII
jgi:exopolyphosphatase/guanosine-5'-triphosphate,3'-diphosphate pyrophosphatase